jgi:hypothetical protein
MHNSSNAGEATGVDGAIEAVMVALPPARREWNPHIEQRRAWTSRPVNELWLQFLALTRGMLALACQFCDAFCVGAGGTTVAFPHRGTQLQAGRGHFALALIRSPFCRTCSSSLRRDIVRRACSTLKSVSTPRWNTSCVRTLQQNRSNARKSLVCFAHLYSPDRT